MKVTSRGIGACIPLLLGLAQMSPASAQSAAKPFKQQVVGHWQLVSVTVNSGTPYGAAPQGSMFLDAGGHVSVIVISDGGARNISYYGSSGGTGNASGRTFKRFVQLQGDEMIVANATPTGAPGQVKLTWKQAN
jgi:hypothetical protein